MKEVYYLNRDALPNMPIPHDCVIQTIRLNGQYMEFLFEDDISDRDSIQYLKPEAKSLIIRYHFAYDAGDYSIYRWVTPGRPFRKDGHFQCLDPSELVKLTEGKRPLEYLSHNVGYCSIILKLFSGVPIILDAEIDSVEYEWIC